MPIFWSSSIATVSSNRAKLILVIINTRLLYYLRRQFHNRKFAFHSSNSEYPLTSIPLCGLSRKGIQLHLELARKRIMSIFSHCLSKLGYIFFCFTATCALKGQLDLLSPQITETVQFPKSVLLDMDIESNDLRLQRNSSSSDGRLLQHASRASIHKYSDYGHLRIVRTLLLVFSNPT